MRVHNCILRKFLAHRRSISHTLTTGYDPHSHGTAERLVWLIKALSSRCLSISGLGNEYWGYSLWYAAQSLCVALQQQQRSPPFGSQIIAQVLGHGNTKYPAERSVTGRLMFWNQKIHVLHIGHSLFVCLAGFYVSACCIHALQDIFRVHGACVHTSWLPSPSKASIFQSCLHSPCHASHDHLER